MDGIADCLKPAVDVDVGDAKDDNAALCHSGVAPGVREQALRHEVL